MEMKDSGKRQEFEGGAVRDTADGKPKMHLLSPHIYELVIETDAVKRNPLNQPKLQGDTHAYILDGIQAFVLTGDMCYLEGALRLALAIWGVDRLCHWLELGAQKYSAFNWAKGMYVTRCLDSLLRHMNKLNDTDEDHGAATMCNLMFIIHYLEEIAAGRLDPKWDDRFNFKLYNPQVAQSLSTLCTPLEVK